MEPRHSVRFLGAWNKDNDVTPKTAFASVVERTD